MKILVTNDDGYRAKGIKSLAKIMKKYGEVTVVAPKFHQSGTSMAVTLGFRPIAVRDFGEDDGVRWMYVDATPASCVKFAIDNVFTDGKPDLVVSGINHGANTATAACYSGTLGAVEEASLNGIPAIGVSLDSLSPDADFSSVEALFPALLDRIMASGCFERGTFLNVNFPNLPVAGIKGVRLAHMGLGHWEKEFEAWDEGSLGALNDSFLWQHYRVNLEDGEKAVFMRGTFINDDNDADTADHLLLEQGWVTIAPINIFMTDMEEYRRRTK